MAKLDDASWHSGSYEFPEGTPEENAATHIGMFVAWAINNDLWGQYPDIDWSAPVQQVRNREITGRTFLLDQCDGKLFSEMLNEKGAPFAEWYYDRYLKDFQRTLAQGLASDYLVLDTWENYERMAESDHRAVQESPAREQTVVEILVKGPARIARACVEKKQP